jgi:hypothetical protein
MIRLLLHLGRPDPVGGMVSLLSGQAASVLVEKGIAVEDAVRTERAFLDAGLADAEMRYHVTGRQGGLAVHLVVDFLFGVEPPGVLKINEPVDFRALAPPHLNEDQVVSSAEGIQEGNAHQSLQILRYVSVVILYIELFVNIYIPTTCTCLPENEIFSLEPPWGGMPDLAF